MKCQILIEHVLELIFDYFDISKTILDKILLQQPIFYFVTKSSPKIMLSSLFIQWSTDRNFGSRPDGMSRPLNGTGPGPVNIFQTMVLIRAG